MTKSYEVDLSEIAVNYEDTQLIENNIVLTLGKIAATSLVIAETDDPLKAHTLARPLHKLGRVNITKEDAQFLENIIIKATNVNNMIKGPILQKIKDAIADDVDQHK